ncbi:hypothetical protein F5Y04DRAFT_9009 [Hypomontagnella monticulosa]|nr:hypothetical protein F5Y04DRAFT_9009 [Hypomontagnella monticulosa]
MRLFCCCINDVVLFEELAGLRFAFICFIAATFIAVIAQTVQGSVSALDIYVTLLLCFGYNYFLIPIYFWRLLTCYDPDIDPTRWSRVPPGPRFLVAYCLLSIGVAIFQLWFWTSDIARSDDCQYYGFLFHPSLLDSGGTRGVNMAFQSIISSFLLFI